MISTTEGKGFVYFQKDKLNYRTILSRNTAGVWDLDEEIKDTNTEIMKFEALVGKSLWCVAYSPDLNVIATGGADSSIKIWNINQTETLEENKDASEDDVVKFDYDLKEHTSEIPFEIKQDEEYFFRSL